MKIVIDENIPVRTGQSLGAMGHDMLDVRGTVIQGMQDSTLWNIAQAAGRLVITADTQFAQTATEEHHGVLIVDMEKPTRKSIHDRVIWALTEYPESRWPGMVVTLHDHGQSIWPEESD